MVPFDDFHDQGPNTRLAVRIQFAAGSSAAAEVRGTLSCARGASQHGAVHREADDPEDGDELAHTGLRRARRLRLQG